MILSVYATVCMQPRQFIEDLTIRIGHRFKIDTVFYRGILGWIGIGYLSNVLRGVSTTFLLARWLSPDTFGAFRYIIALYSIAGAFSFSSYHTGIIRGVAANDTEVVWAGSKKMLTLSCVGSLILFGCAIERWYNGDSIASISLLISACFFPFSSIGSLYGSILTGKGEIKRLTKYNTLGNIAFTSFFLLALAFAHKNLVLISAAFFGIDVAVKNFMSYLQFKKLARSGSASSHLQLGAHLSFMSIFQALAFQIDQLFIQRLFGYTALANYTIATLIPDQVTDFTKSFSGVLLQRKTALLHKSTSHTSLRNTQKQFQLLLGLSFIFWLGYALISYFSFSFLFPAYTGQRLPSILYALGFLSIPSVIGISWLYASHEIKQLWYLNVTNTVLQIILVILCVPLLGSWGGILAKTINRLAVLPLSYPRTPKKSV